MSYFTFRSSFKDIDYSVFEYDNKLFLLLNDEYCSKINVLFS